MIRQNRSWLLYSARVPRAILVTRTMKFDELRSIGHNIADSVASGVGLLIGYHEMDIFAEIRASADGYMTVDFLTGQIEGGTPSPSLAHGISLYRHALADLCVKHDATPGEFQELTARYAMDRIGRRIQVTVADQHGHRAVDDYVGMPARRIKIRDALGRVRGN